MPLPCAVQEPPRGCQQCPRLAAFRAQNQQKFPTYYNGPVPTFRASGERPVRLLIVGLAPGLNGANQTGRPFTADYAGDLLYETLLDYGFATGTYQERADDGLTLSGCSLTNAVRCVPPENKPTTTEIATCNTFLGHEIAALPDLRVILALGTIAHGAVLTALGQRKSAYRFIHGAVHGVGQGNGAGLSLIDSYHCSRYNTNTRRLTTPMFRAVFDTIATTLSLPEKE